MPERVFLLRGSSETRVSAEEFGFLKETCDRYGEHGPVLHSRCIDCFKTLPLAYVLSDSVYTTHGGLFQSSSRVHEDSTLLLGSLEELDKVDMRQVGENDDGNITLNHVLWSCLWMGDGLSENEYFLNRFSFLLFQLSSSDYYKCVAYNACSPHNNSLNRSVFLFALPHCIFFFKFLPHYFQLEVEKLLFLEIKTSNVLIGMVNTGVVRCTVYDESYQMEKILDFFGKKMFSLIQNLTESNIVWITLALLTSATSNCDYKTILTCKDLNITFDDYFVAKDLNLKPLV
ncbi:hypothetical protein IGI04_030279 [Brassica rapa subsp. trilocularis]|uniref:Serine/threonine specific protein phosphatases domain-containing protein n=1 Tax=Brassica rapa subsp. trilocularis TaxID=1813537 RepID=A0ABQ7LSZ6_BRACM|nr:hypothetical protein IGI04_030279 [Brassica rapa subsp. trilocularis]